MRRGITALPQIQVRLHVLEGGGEASSQIYNLCLRVAPHFSSLWFLEPRLTPLSAVRRDTKSTPILDQQRIRELSLFLTEELVLLCSVHLFHAAQNPKVNK